MKSKSPKKPAKQARRILAPTVAQRLQRAMRSIVLVGAAVEHAKADDVSLSDDEILFDAMVQSLLETRDNLYWLTKLDSSTLTRLAPTDDEREAGAR